ncbi:hypothetical protein CANINC_003731 [Pichia inconspicua]|uniref:Uncharacterized protein n=1 Tax=Pichia inconspicua TaxID=52247 RepID=A0A4T0WXZ5_9ASCO|nr:hypothetical protein CANINC_003731 [[Candida] inconspicua]
MIRFSMRQSSVSSSIKEKLYVLDTNTLFDQQQVYFVLGNDSKSTRTFRDYVLCSSHASKNQLSTLGTKVKDKIPNDCLDCAGIAHKTIGKKSPEECTEGEMLCVDLIGPIYNQYALVCIDNRTKSFLLYSEQQESSKR